MCPNHCIKVYSCDSIIIYWPWLSMFPTIKVAWSAVSFHPIMNHKKRVMEVMKASLVHTTRGKQAAVRSDKCASVKPNRLSSPHKSLDGGIDPWSAQGWLTYSHSNLGQEQSGRKEERKKEKATEEEHVSTARKTQNIFTFPGISSRAVGSFITYITCIYKPLLIHE